MKPSLLTLALISAFTAAPMAWAADKDNSISLPENTIQQQNLNTITVVATPFSQQIGTQTINQRDISRRPRGNGNLTELLNNNINVRFSNNANSSLSAGEISPNEVSFHGEKFYNNNFTINGMSNNDNLNPATGAGGNDANHADGLNPYELPGGGTQSFWIDSDLVKNIEVFDSNISAEYGQFTGGVINANLIDPNVRRASGKISFRMTRDNWAKFQIQEGTEQDFYETSRASYQPEFSKRQYGLMLNQPLNSKSALLFSYNRSESKIPYRHSALRDADQLLAADGTYRETKTQTNETFMLRGLYNQDANSIWKVTAIYSPHTTENVKGNVYNSKFSNTGGGYRFNLEWEKMFDNGLLMKSFAGFQQTGDKIEHDGENYHLYRRGTPSITWRASGATAPEGGYGTYETKKRTFTLKQNFSGFKFDTGAIKHSLKFGWQADFNRSGYDRNHDVFNYSVYTTSNAARVNCADTDACIQGEQYATRRIRYPAVNASVNDSNFSAYVEDNMKWKRLDATLGLRIDRSRLLGNTNIAPRFSTSYDIFGDKSSRVFGGLNRYYSGTLLAYKLRENINNQYTQTRTLSGSTLSDWSEGTYALAGSRRYMMSDNLKTPYSDEAVLGLEQRLFNTIWTLKWVHRNSKDGWTREGATIDNERVSMLVNKGWQKSNTVTLEIRPERTQRFKWVHVNGSVGVNFSRSKANNTYYDEPTVDVAGGVEKVVYDGKLMDAGDLPPNDYNTPWQAKGELNLHFPKIHLNWDMQFRYTPGHKNRWIEEDNVACSSVRYISCGNYAGNVDVYNTGRNGGFFLTDWRFSLNLPTFKRQSLELNLDINNVFNRRAVVNTTRSTKTYKMGRNFWLGASYRW